MNLAVLLCLWTILAQAQEWELSLVNDLREIALADPPRSVLFTLMRAVLDLAGDDARLGVPLSERLRVLDPVSYVRFASVYKGFEELGDFEREVGELQKSTAPKVRPQ